MIIINHGRYVLFMSSPVELFLLLLFIFRKNRHKWLTHIDYVSPVMRAKNIRRLGMYVGAKLLMKFNLLLHNNPDTCVLYTII